MDIGKNSVAHKHLLYSKKLLHSRSKVGCKHFTMFGVMLLVPCIRWVGVGFLRSAWCDMYDGRPSLHDDRKVKRATARVNTSHLRPAAGSREARGSSNST